MGVSEIIADFLDIQVDSPHPPWFLSWWAFIASGALAMLNFLGVGIFFGYRSAEFFFSALAGCVLLAPLEIVILHKAVSLVIRRLFPRKGTKEAPKPASKPFVAPGPARTPYAAQEPPGPILKVMPGPPVEPRLSLRERILLGLEEGAATATMLEGRMDYPKHAVWQFLQPLVKEGRVIRYEEVEIPHAGVEIYYALPARGESSFHTALVGKAHDVLADVGTVKKLSRWGNPDLLFNERVAVEVETCAKDDLTGFADQVIKRFEQGYGAVIVVTINKRQQRRYLEALRGFEHVAVVTFRELAKVAERTG
ncbi:MAG: hypothetical protein PHV13_04350 [Candidatus ainarchaeum sp.]|nr:hypothetical protein [Candidatus ainarchaeum sp.]